MAPIYFPFHIFAHSVRPMPDPICGVLYQTWQHADGSFRIEFLSDDAELVMEATADEGTPRTLRQLRYRDHRVRP